MSPKINNSLPPDKDTRIAQLEQALAIEAALEKVRVRTMTMQKSEELAEVASLVFQQLEAIGLVNPEERFHFSIHDEQKDTTINWMTEPGGKKIVKGFEFQLTKLFYPLDRDFTAWKNTPIWERKKLLLNTIYEGETLKKLLNFVSSNPDFISNPSNQEFLENPPNQLAQNAAHFSHGVLCVTSSIKFPKEKLQILQRFAITFEQTYTRFLDLQKAEEQTREAQIEAALERVRAASMAMHKTEELAKVVTVLFNQLQTLEIDIVLAIVAIFHTEKRRADAWFSPIDNQQTEAFLVQLPFEPWENTTVKDWQEGKPFGYISVSGKEKVSAYAKQIDAFNNWNLFEAYADNLSATAMEQTNANHQFGHLGIIQLQKATEAEKAILLRFAKVFEQTYTRFLDLQKAEKQTREAQIEAALERVRAASMAMHKSKELPNVALAILKEANYLDIAKAGCAIGIFDMEERTVHSYGANMVAGEIVLGKVLNHSIDSFWVLQESVRRIDIGDSPITIELKDKHLQEVADYINDEDDSGVSFHLENKSIYYNLVPFYEYSVISISSLQPLLESEFEILKRMARTLRMSYIRFLDLQKAEAQAKEAQIEAALERVRAASMAMHKPEELSAVALVIFQQLASLGIQTRQSWIAIIRASEGYGDIWSSMSKTEAMIPNKVTLNLQHTAYQPLIEEWKSGAPFLATQFEGAEVVQHFQKLNEMTGIDFYDLDNHPPYIEHFEACHQYGVLSIEMDTQIEQSIKDIVLRLAKVFEQTYTRFLDLQKAEEQAREAQIEAALERVRAASMAMHKSKDLGKVIQEVMHQMEQLGVLVDSACIHVIKEGTKDFGIWVATTPENSYPVEIYVPYIKHITMDRLPQSIAQKEKLLVLSDKFIDRVETKKRFFLK